MKSPWICLGALLPGLLWLSCQTRSAATTDTTGQTTPAAESAQTCYGYTSANDTIRLTLVRTGDDVTGDLTYQLSGKDRNTGTITGLMQQDTLLARYSFQSEGVESAREVAFLVRGDTLREGYGPVSEQNGTMRFTDKAKLTFGSGFPLAKQACTE